MNKKKNQILFFTVLIVLLCMSFSCCKNKKQVNPKRFSVEIDSIEYEKLFHWLTAKNEFILLYVSVDKNTPDPIPLDSINFKMFFKGKELKIDYYIDIDRKRNTLVDSSEIVHVEVQDISYGNVIFGFSLKDLLENNNYLITENTFLTYYVNPNNIDTVYFSKTIPIKLLLDSKAVDEKDSIRLNYFGEPIPGMEDIWHTIKNKK